MCTPLDRLSRLSSAEQFFVTLGIDFDPHVLNVHRLHLLNRFRQHLNIDKLEGLTDEEVEACCKVALTKAYAEFAGGTGPKSFKVFQQQQTGFVSLSDIRPTR